MAGCGVYRYGATIKYHFKEVNHHLGSTIQNHLLNIQGKGIPRRVIVFESDDWGSIRIPSYDSYIKLKNLGIDLDKNPYNRVDSLETVNDIGALIEVLSSVKDSHGNHPIFTTNFIVGNPDFERIERDGFSKYTFETFIETYQRSDQTKGNWDLIKEAVKYKLIKPQFHGREHVNALRWLSILQNGNPNMSAAFKEGVFCIDVNNGSQKRNNLMATLDFYNDEEKKFCINQIEEGTRIFNEVFGFRSLSFIAPANVWDQTLELVLDKSGVRFIQGFRGQKIPSTNKGGYRTKIHHTGEKSNFGQIYLVRNAYFEPSTLDSYDWIGNCLRKINAAFFWNKPAIISTHRLNYIGSISERNRIDNLNALRQLLREILIRWPEVEFLSSDELGILYEN